MLQFVQITAQYSNAVLVAIMPYIADFSQRLDLPISKPVTTNMVRVFKCDNRRGKVGGLLVLTNGYQFSYLDGRVCVFRSPWSYYSLQDPDLIPKFYGDVKLTQAEALQIAHETIQKLGYNEAIFFADRPPKVTQPVRIHGKYVPRFRFQWLDPDRIGNSAGNILPVVLDIEVDARDGRVVMYSTTSKKTVRDGPKIALTPQLAENPFGEDRKWTGGGIPTQSVSHGYSNQFLNAILPQLSDFIYRLGLPIATPLSTNQIDLPRFSCGLFQGQPTAQIYFKNGDRFNFEHGHVCAFYGHDAFLKFPETGNPNDCMGKNQISEDEARVLAEHALRSVGYSGKLSNQAVQTRRGNGSQDFTRRIFFWGKPSSDILDIGSVEVDLETKSIKGIYCDDSSLWRDPPGINSSEK